MTLHSLIRAIAAPHQEQETSSRFSITGSDVTVSGGVISSLALLLHEFVTIRHQVRCSCGCLRGYVEIDCADQAGMVAITWSEHGGPPVVPPLDKRGFGDVLIRSTVESLGGEDRQGLEARGSRHPAFRPAQKPHRLINGVKRFPGALPGMAAIDLVRGTRGGPDGVYGRLQSQGEELHAQGSAYKGSRASRKRRQE